MSEEKAKEMKKIKDFINRIANRLSAAYAAFELFDTLMEQKAINLLDEETVRKNLKTINDYGHFFSTVFYATNSFFLLELVKFFDKSKDALTLNKLKNCIEGGKKKLTAEAFLEANKGRYEVESLSRAFEGLSTEDINEIDELLNNHDESISSLIAYRDEHLGHDDIKKSNISITLGEVEDLFGLVESILNKFAYALDHSTWEFSYIRQSVTEDTEMVIDHLKRFKPYYLKEIEAEFKSQYNGRKD